MTTLRRLVSAAFAALFVLSMMLVATPARADHDGAPGRAGVVRVVQLTARVEKVTLHLTPPSGGSVVLYDGASAVGALTAAGSMQVDAGKEYTLTAQRGTKTIWSAPIAVASGGMQMRWLDGRSAPVMGAAPAQVSAPIVTLPGTKPIVVTQPQVVAVVASPAPGHAGHHHGALVPYVAPQAMSDTAFTALLALVDEKAFDSTRIEVIKTAAATSHFSVAQVTKLLEKITFDSNRLDALKAIHTRIVDRENAVMLSKSFTFNSNQTEALKLFQSPVSI